MGFALFGSASESESETNIYNTTQTWQDSNNRVVNDTLTLSESGNTTITLPAPPGNVGAAAGPAATLIPYLAAGMVGLGVWMLTRHR